MMKEKSENSLVFVRHGHRDKPTPDVDNGISPKGLTQVEDLLKDFKKGRLPQSKIFWSSPKKRCVETLGPVAKLAGAPLKVEKLLDEQSSTESTLEFNKRIMELIKKATETGEVVYLCSHGDFIPQAIDFLTGKFVDVSKGQAIQVTKSEGHWDLL
jgi:broad specificity phosphatase PhoE